MLKLPPIYFYIIWPILYVFLVITYLLFVLRPPSNRKIFKYATIFFWMNLFFNFLYLVLFFGLDSYYGGLIDLILLVVTGWITVILFFLSDSKYKIIYSILYFFYVLWLSFALIIMTL